MNAQRRLLVAVALLVASTATAQTERTRVLDLTADTLPAGEGEFGLFWLRYAKGIAPGLQVQSHVGALLTGTLNAEVKYRFFDEGDVRLSAQAGATWAALATVLSRTMKNLPKLDYVSAPLWLRASVPIVDSLELTTSAGYEWFLLSTDGAALHQQSVKAQASL